MTTLFAGPPSPHVAILLCAYKGEKYIINQLDSIFAQTHKNISLWVSVDTDVTDVSQDSFYQTLLKILDSKNNNPDNPIKMTIIRGPGKGCNYNFLSLVCNEDIDADYYAYSDQDDIWHEDKISRALAQLNELPADVPNMYCSRTQIVDASGKNIGISPLFKRKPSFSNALVQSIGGGNTMVFNRNTRDILKRIGNIEIVCHDWWTYQMVSAVGGNVIYDPVSTLKYRQHGNNIVGANVGWLARMTRIRLLLKGKFQDWNDINIKALEKVKPYIAEDNRKILDNFITARKNLFWPRIWGIYKSGVYRQTFVGNLGLWVAVFLKKI